MFLITVSIGCSRLQFVADWADYFVIETADDYFDLSREQKRALNPYADEVVSVAKNKAVPELSVILEMAAADIETQKLSLEQILTYQKRAEMLFKQFLLEMEPLVEKSYPVLKENNWLFFYDALKDKNSELRDEVNSGKRTKKQIESWIERADDLAGSLTSRQENLISEMLKKSSFPWEDQIKFREELGGQIFGKRKNSEEMRKLIFALTHDLDSLRPRAYQEGLERYRKQSAENMWNLFQSFSESQKKHIAQRLRKQAADLRKIK